MKDGPIRSESYPGQNSEVAMTSDDILSEEEHMEKEEEDPLTEEGEDFQGNETIEENENGEVSCEI